MFFSPKISSYSQGISAQKFIHSKLSCFFCNFRSCPKLIAAIRSPGTKIDIGPKKGARTWLHSDSGAPATAWRRWKKVWSPCYSEASQNCCNKSIMWGLNGDPVKKVDLEWFQRFCANPCNKRIFGQSCNVWVPWFSGNFCTQKAAHGIVLSACHREPVFSSWWGKDQPNQRQMTVKLQGTL